MTETEIAQRLLKYIRERFLGDDRASALDGETPLLEWGILNSMSTAELVGFISREFGRSVPQSSVNAKNFKTANQIAALVARTSLN
ncbi:acyl carrier protein [Nocardia sp. NPDC051981]|uniref:acyl carrier protein n=1 Tax=Nocardia sp. NPDC051981 TaxID=3155417 RepID=UPI003426C4A1